MKYKVGDLVVFTKTYYDNTYEIKVGTLAKVSYYICDKYSHYECIDIELLYPFDDDEGLEIIEISGVEGYIGKAEFAKTELYKALNEG